MADLVTTPSRSLLHQSFDSRERMKGTKTLHAHHNATVNGDGFGVAWYESEENGEDAAPCLFRSLKPAWNDRNLHSLARKIYTNLFFAHVRAASPALPVDETSCHPFCHGRYMFMHNGGVGEFHLVRRALVDSLSDDLFAFVMLNGGSDTCVCFAVLLQMIYADDPTFQKELSPETLSKHLLALLRKLEDVALMQGCKTPSFLNVALTDGSTVLCSRYSTLHTEASVSLYLCCGDYWEFESMVPAVGKANCVVISSEPITDNRADWMAVEEQSMVVITKTSFGLDVTMFSVDNEEMIGNALVSLRNTTRDTTSRVIPIPPSPSTLKRGRDIETLTARHTLTGGHSISACAFDKERHFLFVGDNGGVIRVWCLQKLTVVSILMVPTDQSNSLSIYDMAAVMLGDAQFCVGALYSDRKLRLWGTTPLSAASILLEVQLDVIASSLVCYAVDHTVGSDKFAFTAALGMKNMSVVLKRIHGSLVPVEAVAGCVEDVPTERGHVGYIYDMTLCGDGYVATAGGDGFICLWDSQSGKLMHRLQGHAASVLCLHVTDSNRGVLYSGSSDGTIRVWDLESGACKRRIETGFSEVCRMTSFENYLIAYSACGLLYAWDPLGFDIRYHCVPRLYPAQESETALCYTTLCSFRYEHQWVVAGTKDGTMLVWRIPQWMTRHDSLTNIRAEMPSSPGQHLLAQGSLEDVPLLLSDTVTSSSDDGGQPNKRMRSSFMWKLEELLDTFVSFRTVSADSRYREHMWQAAKFLSLLMQDLGCEVKLAGEEDQAPVVMGKLAPSSSKEPTILIYGHYDVQPADPDEWETDPFVVTGRDGWYFGRGVSDNKGPILAVLMAVQELLIESSSVGNSNSHSSSSFSATEREIKHPGFVFLFEGEEEHGSVGFQGVVAKERAFIGNVDVCLCTNSYWFGEDHPCITYGMRGVMEMDIVVKGMDRNLHAGIDGGIVAEPLNDLLAVTSSLVDSSNMVLVPGFYENVRAVSDRETALMLRIDVNLEEYMKSVGMSSTHAGIKNNMDFLCKRWCEPTLSISAVASSNAANAYRLIPRTATARVTITYVPDQDTQQLQELLRRHVAHEFSKRHSPNKITVRFPFVGDWWLSDPDGPIYGAASKAVKDVWGIAPMAVREGGSMPNMRFLQNALDLPAAALIVIPLGQSSDAAHLPNERIRGHNLKQGIRVLRRFFKNLCETKS